GRSNVKEFREEDSTLNHATFLSKNLDHLKTPLGFNVRVTQAYWQLITTIKHPVMAGRETEVRVTLETPDEIRQSKVDQSVSLSVL
ncbi:MAG: hypothetical protein JXA78_11160, partial [Anaerolineales bacterium]|nr:hypothetical protein [Anaerolineales bacterium]